MITKRIIPCLDVKDGRVVKGVNFENLGDVASPVDMAKLYTKSGADTLHRDTHGDCVECLYPSDSRRRDQQYCRL